MSRARIFYAGFLQKAGGAFMHARTVAVDLRQRGWDVTLVTLDSLPLWCRYVPPIAQKLVSLFSVTKGILVRGAITRWLYQRFFREVVDFQLFEEIYVAWDSAIPSATVLHAVWSDNLQAFDVSKAASDALKKSEAAIINRLRQPIVTVSRPYLDFLVQEHFAGISLRPILVVELGVPGRPSPPVVERRVNSLVYVGALEARKNLHLLLDVIGLLVERDKDYHLTIIGDGPQRDELIARARRKHLPVTFLGRMDNEQVLIELSRHDLYVHTSVKESFSFSLLEAKLSGLTTCAFADLQVPSEFIDIAVGSFDAIDWAEAIVNRRTRASHFDPENYTAARMVSRTLDLASRALG